MGVIVLSIKKKVMELFESENTNGHEFVLKNSKCLGYSE